MQPQTLGLHYHQLSTPEYKMKSSKSQPDWEAFEGKNQWLSKNFSLLQSWEMIAKWSFYHLPTWKTMAGKPYFSNMIFIL